MMKKFFLCLLTIVWCAAASAEERPVELHTPTGTIYGTLNCPDDSRKQPLVIFHAGSGPTDRDCNSGLGLKTNAFRMLADSLAEAGIASLRFDKRGIAASAAAGPTESDLRFENYIDDLKAWVAEYRDAPFVSRIILLGHSEGSTIALAAAQQNPDVAAVISVAGPGRPVGDVLNEQLSAGLPDNLRGLARSIVDSLSAGHRITNQHPLLFGALFRPSVQPYMISWMRWNPAELVADLGKPLLVIQGDKDIQVSVHDAERLAAATPSAQLIVIPDMNHVLKFCDTMDRAANAAGYQSPQTPLRVGLVSCIVRFVKEQTNDASVRINSN